MTQVDKNGTITTYEYDLNGNLVGDSNGSFYGYDEENRLVYAKVDGVVSENGISTEGLRVSKGVGNDYTYEESTAYTIDQDGNVILENGDDIIRGHQALAKRTEDGSYYYYIYNGHGDVVMLVDESENVKNSYQYDAWGKITSETETIPNSIKYAGEYYDAETGFLYLRNRMYDPTTRRFTSEDPARDQLNWYVYCGNNPVIYVDTTGCHESLVTMIVDGYSTTVGLRWNLRKLLDVTHGVLKIEPGVIKLKALGGYAEIWDGGTWKTQPYFETNHYHFSVGEFLSLLGISYTKESVIFEVTKEDARHNKMKYTARKLGVTVTGELISLAGSTLVNSLMTLIDSAGDFDGDWVPTIKKPLAEGTYVINTFQVDGKITIRETVAIGSSSDEMERKLEVLYWNNDNQEYFYEFLYGWENP